jgi:hypothetical protein
MKASKTVRKKWFKVRVTEDELRKIKAFSKASACRGCQQLCPQSSSSKTGTHKISQRICR